MEKRFSDMLNRNTQRKYLPKSLTDEIVEHKFKLQEQNVKNAVGLPQNTPEIGYNQLRDAITERLGGPFDYALYQEDLKDITSELDSIKREFRNQALLQPEFKDSSLHKVPEFDFTLPGVSPDSQFAAGEQTFQPTDVKVSHNKP